MESSFVFPDGLQELTDKRLGVDARNTEIFLAGLDRKNFEGRITDISLKGSNSYVMTFRLDGRKSGKCMLDSMQAAWLDAGYITVMDVALYYCRSIKPGFGRTPIQQTLF